MILTCGDMRRLEAEAFKAGITADILMEQAGQRIALAIKQFFPNPGVCVIYSGAGHNGGDALVAARYLVADGWHVQRRHIFTRLMLNELTRKQLESVDNRVDRALHMEDIIRRSPLVLLDGLLGISAKGALREPVRRFAWEINKLRREWNASVVAIDIPTGLNGDTGEADPDCVVADYTLTIGFPKTGLLADGAANYVGRLAVLPLDELTARKNILSSEAVVATSVQIAPLIPRRKFNTHKGECGRVGIVAGSRGFVGAALMAAAAAVRAGAGLVTLYVTEDIYPIAAAAALPEIMVAPVSSYEGILERPHDALAIGPGLGVGRRDEILNLIKKCPMPAVIDADALNILSTNISILDDCAGPRLLTPHPGEMSRLFETNGLTRKEIVERFTGQYPVTLLLKGSRTLVGQHGQPYSFNSTGNPGMATGGMGDVLTGVCAALLARKLNSYDAARAGAWLCGCAAEIAMIRYKHSEESLAATDLFKTLGQAFKQAREGAW